MIKRVFTVLFCAVLAATACGCAGYRETDSSYIVTAIGFDKAEKIKVSVEVVTSGDERDGSHYSEIITGEGDTPEEATFSLTNKISKILMFDHCTAVLIGESLEYNDFKEIIRYGKELKELNLAVYLLVCENAEDLLKKSQPVSVSRGYDIAGNIKETKKDTGIDYKNRFFEVFAAYKSENFYNLPLISTKDNRIIINGEAVYKIDRRKTVFSNDESIIYSFFTNNNKGGKIYFGKEYADITASRFKLDNKRYVATVYIKNESKGFKKAFSKKCNDFLKEYNDILELKAEKVTVRIKGGV